MVKTMDKIGKGEERASLLAKSMRSMVAAQMQKDGASDEAMAAVRMTPDAKKKIVEAFDQRRAGRAGGPSQITEEVSVNADTGADSQPLLQGDHDEELGMKDRLQEK